MATSKKEETSVARRLPHTFSRELIPLTVQSTIQESLGLSLQEVPTDYQSLSRLLWNMQDKINKLPWKQLEKDLQGQKAREDFLERGEAQIRRDREELSRKETEAKAQLELAQSAFAFQEAYETVRDDFARAVAKAIRDSREEDY